MKANEEKVNIVPNAAFPFCVYKYKAEGINLTQYNETYCNQFQVKYLTLFLLAPYSYPCSTSTCIIYISAIADFQRTRHVLHL